MCEDRHRYTRTMYSISRLDYTRLYFGEGKGQNGQCGQCTPFRIVIGSPSTEELSAYDHLDRSSRVEGLKREWDMNTSSEKLQEVKTTDALTSSTILSSPTSHVHTVLG